MKRTIRWTLAIGMIALGASSTQVRADEGLYASVDLLFLSPKLNAVNFNSIFYVGSPVAQTADGQLNAPLEFCQRVIVGYEGDLGGGVQVRWFTFDQSAFFNGRGNDSVNGVVPIDGDLGFDVDYIDAELTQRGNFRYWDWLATAGARYARVDIHEQISDEFEWEDWGDALWFGLAGQEFEGAGPTMSVMGARPIFHPGFSIFGRARTALLFGEIEIDSPFMSNGGPLVINDVFAQVWELQAGMLWEHQFDACDLIGGFFWEAQRWDNDSNIGEFALHGFGVNAGIIY